MHNENHQSSCAVIGEMLALLSYKYVLLDNTEVIDCRKWSLYNQVA